MKLKLFVAGLMALSTSIFAAESCLGGGNTKISTSQVEKALSGILGNAKVVSVSDSPIQGLYEVIIETGNKKVPIYVDCNLKYLVNGEIIDVNKKVSLTRERFQQLQSQVNSEKETKLSKIMGKDKVEMLKKEGLLDLIMFVDTKNLPKSNVTYGNGNNVVYVFTDPQCPFCAKLHKEIEQVLKNRKDVKFEMVLYPLPFHKHARGISENIECQKDNTSKQNLLNKAFESVASNNESGLSALDKACATAKSVIDKNLQYAQSVGINGTPTIIFPNKGVAVSGAISADTLNKLIDALK
ncbi:DsbC family protein [Sulfurihydrogenibium sp.]|uniref:DsbC family protein n=1 Tax=Sulfurihydrogenibium sp. TaxID=2053621 RepID=UPI002604034B|nr:DsbC family protein [Sulfurihydrogenibium sp.]